MNKSILHIIILVILFNSCNISDSSTPEEGKNEITTSELLRSSISQMAYNHSAIGSRACATLVQYYGEFDSKVNSFEGYFFNSSFFEELWSDGFYAGSLVNIKELRDLAVANDNTNLEAISMVLQANEFNNITMMFGDIPYSESLLGSENIEPAYDSQERIITELVALLDSAISMMSDTETLEPALSSSDLIFNGDIDRWIKFAHGLKARILVNTLNKGNVDLNLLMSSLNKSFQSSDEEAQFQFSVGFPNPHYLFATQRPYSFYISDTFYELLNDLGDPRLSSFTKLVGTDWLHFELNEFEPIHYREYASIPILSFTELLFIRAELVHHMQGDIDEVGQSLKSAILSSLEDHEVNINAVAVDYVDSLSSVVSLSETERLKRIIEQAYIAYYGFNHLQSWSNFRRTNYPLLESTATNPNPQNPSNSIPVRIMYPQSEYIYNRTNVNDAVSRQNGAFLDSGMWIFN